MMTIGQTAVAEDDYRIVPAALWDLPAIQRLERVIFPHDAYTRFDLLLLFLNPHMVNLKMLTPDGGLVGFASGGRLLGLGKTWIMTIGIHPDHQRRGLGRRLLAMCEARVRERPIYLTVRASNDRALALYRRNGYRQVRVKYRYYVDGETGLEMRKDTRD